MKKYFKLVLLVAFLIEGNVYSWAQAPSTEGQDFWVTFLRASENDGGPDTLKLTISAKEACTITIQQPGVARDITFNVGDNSSTEISTNGGPGGQRIQEAKCYSMNNETVTQTALHVTATKDISLFAGNFREMSFDAANILPTSALLDDYLIQTYPPSDHENKPQGSHFAIVAVEDNTVVDYTLTAATNGGKTGRQTTPTLKKGDVWYVWTGNKAGDVADLSGTTVTARDKKKIAVFQGCPHTNIPNKVRDRDHIYSQAMPIAYWGTEFGITASRKHRRDIVAVMAINDGTQVYINSEDGEPQLVHTFDFNVDKKHYWTFEIGESLAYCADKDQMKTLDPPLVADSSCFLTTSCPAGVHLFMVSNRYDNVTETVEDDSLVSDPAMLWISPIEQVIKEINFATYHTEYIHKGKPAGTKFHFMNILTTTENVKTMTWNGTNIKQYFSPLRGNEDYSFARIPIPRGNHNLKGKTGFLAHVYGYGWKESYAYSCGSSTVQRSIAFNDEPLDIDSVTNTHFCLGDTINMKLNIGNNNYESVLWDFGDGITYSSRPGASNNEKKTAQHAYSTPGWYDLLVTAKYVNACTGKEYTENLGLSFCVVRADTVWHVKDTCVSEDYQGDAKTLMDTVDYDCDSVVVTQNFVHRVIPNRFDATAFNDTIINGVYYDETPAEPITWTIEKGNYNGRCDSIFVCNLTIKKCLNLEISNDSAAQFACYGDTYDLPFSMHKDGDYGAVYFALEGKRAEVLSPDAIKVLETVDGRDIGIITLPTESLQPGRYKATVEVEDNNCGGRAVSPVLDIAVRYPKEVFNFKFNNVLAVYKTNHGGNEGWEFREYQWYLNGEKIENAIESVYHTEEIFKPGDVYFVELTDAKGMKLRSCEFTVPEDIDHYEQEESEPAAVKTFVNRRLYIQKGNVLYDMYGQRVK